METKRPHEEAKTLMTDDWSASMDRLSEWAMKITRAQEDDLSEVRRLCVEAFATVLGADGGWMWVSDREERLVGAHHGDSCLPYAESIEQEQVDALWFGIHEVEASETSWLLDDKVAEALGPHALAVPIPTGGHRLALVMLYRREAPFSSMQCQIANTLMAMTHAGPLMILLL